MKKLLLASTALVAFAAGAQAADLGAPRMPIAAAVVAPAFNWTGFYAGAQIGYGWAHQGWVTPPVFFNPWKSNGIFGGIHAGYNHQINMLVLGVQAEINGAGLTGSVINGARTFTARTNMFGSLDARAGIAVDRALLYVIGGLAYTDNRHRTFETPPGGGGLTDATFRQGRVGWNVGAGVEYAFTPNWTARVEYRYYDFGTASYGTTGTLLPHTHRHYMHTVRLGVSYLFSTGASAVVARY